MKRFWVILVAVCSGLVALALAAVGRSAAQPPEQRPPVELEGACGNANPYFVTSCYSRGLSADETALVAFRDTPNNTDHHPLATQGQVGATYGLAYDGKNHLLYAGAYLKRGVPFGPGGPGAIYRIDMATQAVDTWLQVPNAGPDLHDRAGDYFPDSRVRAGVGTTSLGDIDVTPDGGELFVMNLLDRSIYRYRTSDKALLGKIPHGASKSGWAVDARPFALAAHDEKLYHGVVNSALKSERQRDLAAYIYESDLDGSNMHLVASFPLDYPRGSIVGGFGRGGGPGQSGRWQIWSNVASAGVRGGQGPGFRVYPQPILSDIEFADNGDMIVGMRDRTGDMGYFYMRAADLPRVGNEPAAIPGGDILIGRYDDGDWTFENDPEFFAEDAGPGIGARTGVHEETSFGGLARVRIQNVVVMTAMTPLRISTGGAYWFNIDSGDNTRREELYSNDLQLNFGKANGLGDLELICPLEIPPTVTPSPTATDIPTVTDTPAVTDTPEATPTVTETPTPSVYRIYLPFTHKAEACIPDAYHTDVVLVLDRSTSMLRPVEEGGLAKNEAAIEAAKAFVRQLDFTPDMLGRHDQVAIVGFNDSAWTETDLTNDLGTALDSLERIRTKTIEGTRLDLALVEGQKPLDGPRHKPENRPVLVLLTDGIPNRVPTPTGGGVQEDTVLVAARAAKARGTRLYSIGLGKPTDILPRLLIEAASERWMYYYAPKPEDLAGIYTQIAHTFDECGPQRFPVPTPCVAEEVHTDVVLVLDMSTSMYRETRSGRTKQAAALEAAKAFVSDLDLERDGWGRQDQVAIVGFNESAWTAIGLTENRVLVNGALDGLAARSHEGTRLDLAFKEGQAALERGPRLAENRGVLILLTDGLPNQVPTPSAGGTQEDTVLGQAARAKEKGTRVYTIGLGRPEDILSWMLEAAASEPSMYYYAPDGEDLADIYRQIAGRITECHPVGP